jgi:hypothetical protein
VTRRTMLSMLLLAGPGSPPWWTPRVVGPVRAARSIRDGADVAEVRPGWYCNAQDHPDFLRPWFRPAGVAMETIPEGCTGPALLYCYPGLA